MTLDPKFDHLGRIFGDTLPPGVDIDGKASKTLLTGTETRGYLTFRALPTTKPAEQTACLRDGQRLDQLRDEGDVQQPSRSS